MSYVVSAAEADRQVPPSGHAGRARVDDLSGDDGRSAAADVRGERARRSAKDFFLAFSPERVDPGQREVQHAQHAEGRRRDHAGLLRGGGGAVSAAVDTVVPVSSTQVAEMVKLLENTFRAVNIGLVNEIALMCAPDEHRRLGSHRRGQDQAVRLHAVLSRAPASAATAFRSIRSTCRGRRGRPASNAASSSWPATSTARCRTTSSSGSARR